MELLLIVLVAGGFLWMLGAAATPSGPNKKRDENTPDSPYGKDTH